MKVSLYARVFLKKHVFQGEDKRSWGTDRAKLIVKQKREKIKFGDEFNRDTCQLFCLREMRKGSCYVMIKP